MEQVVSCRFGEKEITFLTEYSREANESKGSVLRELLEEGRKMQALKYYKEGKASLGKAARIAGVSISEMIDLLGEFGVKAGLTLEDFKESGLNTEAVLKGSPQPVGERPLKKGLARNLEKARRGRFRKTSSLARPG